MAFFARPNLDNTQFKQLKGGEPLTLSGQTQIATTSGLTLFGDAGTGPAAYGGMYIPIIATGASNNFVLTYDGTQKAIVLKQSTSSGGTTVYPYSGLTTCTVGGITAGTSIYNDEVVDILQDILSPTVYPDLTSPSISSFTINPTSLLYEVGAVASISATVAFNPGAIDPVYPPTACSCRSDGTLCYIYTALAFPYECVTNAPSNIYPFTPTPVQPGSNVVSASVCYQGGTQPYDSSGAMYDTPLSTGVTATSSKTITGTYPWYWGIEASGGVPIGVNRPTACCVKDVITGGTYGCKCVGLSTGTLFVNFGSTSDDYLWFATPVASITKTWWYVDALNNNAIGGAVNPAGNLFPDPETVSAVTTTCWSGQEYNIYISNKQSCSTSIMELRNS